MIEHFPISMDSLDRIHRSVGTFASQENLTTDTTNRILLVLEELLINIVRHSPARSDRVEVELTREGGLVTVRFESAPGDLVDPRLGPRPDPDIPLKDRPVGGLGLHLIREVSDEIEFCSDQAKAQIIARIRVEN